MSTRPTSWGRWRNRAQYLRLAATREMEKPPTLRSWAPVPAAGCGLGDREAAHPAVLGTSTCGWLWPGRQRSHPPCGPGHQHLQLAAAREMEKPPTLRSWAPKCPTGHTPIKPCRAGDAASYPGAVAGVRPKFPRPWPAPGSLTQTRHATRPQTHCATGPINAPPEKKGEGQRVRNINERETSISCLLHTSY
ncbi:hypothetical protein QTO34_000548, partial [Cnephaeus nilssonii]